MKKIILVFLLLSLKALSQSEQDTKDFIIENVTSNNPIPSYKNGVFFQNNILKLDANDLAGKILTEDEFNNIFIYARDCFTDETQTHCWLTKAETIDIRAITKVSTTKFTGENNYYSINVYITSAYYAKGYSQSGNEKSKYNYLSKMVILIADNTEVVKKIKKAIIHLGLLNGITVTDGDLF